MQQNSPKKTIAEWKQSRHSAPQNQHPTQPTEPPHPSAIDLLRNRNPTTPLGPFDGRVGAIAEVNGEKYYITMNTDYIPAVPSLQHPHAVYLRSDMRYGTDDPTLWLQQWTDRYCHMPLIAKKGTCADLAPMWWDPSPRDWIVGSAVTRALGRLPVGRISWLVEVVHKVLIQHILMWVEQLQSLPTTFPKMLFALTSLQREVLELDALYEYISIYKTQIAHYVPGTAHSVTKTVGAFTSSPGVAQQLWSAGIPFWFLRPTYVFNAENILEVVPLLEPSFSLPDPDAHAVGAPPVLYTGNSTLDKIDVIHCAALHTPWYHDPFETGVGHASSPSLPPIASTSAQSDARPPPSISNRAPPRPQSSASRYRPYAPKANTPKGTPKVARDKFAPITAPEMPPSIICMENALAKVDCTSCPYTAADTRYVLPEPALFLNNNLACRYKWLHHWKLLRDAVWFMLVDNPQLLAPQQWRDAQQGSRGDCPPGVAASGTENLGALPVADELVPEFTLEETREIIWEVAEAGFRFELCALDRKASGKQRLAQVKDCFAGHMLIGTPLRLAKLGWAAPTLEERHRYVARTAQLMVDWRTSSSPLRILQRVVDRRPWSVSGMQELETAVCEYYTQAFWEHFGHAAVLPVRLEHDLVEEQEDNMDKEPGEL
ncbi:hypothetical protein C8F04DRAFT_1266136 [Mycena alexandri]|uniref:Uncharacterized protein n=1 Tax=Mycena alexandri TaxID=1745969 RepID=A0AAD6SHR1_9AGAR|nr:hypothetical protein C8F04DRAFT_1266136 [Mycena alexandri]